MIQVINKHLAKHGNAIIPNPFEATKAYLIAHAENKLTKHLPHSVSVLIYPYDSPEDIGYNLHKWYQALMSYGLIDYSKNPKLFRELVENIDLSKPFDPVVAESISSKFKAEPKKLTFELDAVAIEEER